MNYDMSIHTNPDARAWAKFFMKTKEENPNLVIDEGLMIGWFANAMMAMHDHLKGVTALNGDHVQSVCDNIVAWGHRGRDGQIRDCIAPDTHAECEGDYTIPLFTRQTE